ncbi:MAG: hypothetical protein JSR94_15640 [Proteobacteria bacterium]|nr:hypothetical protein [Pseudomonadota bacterium]
MAWEYDPGEPRHKHCGNKPEAEFVGSGSGLIGKCSSSIDHQTAWRLLNEGIPLEGTQDSPQKIVNVFMGVIYVAVPTVPGRSFHGYPWRRRPGNHGMPRQMLKKLRARAEQDGYVRQFDDWVRDYGQ